jgi:hypothetical protein
MSGALVALRGHFVLRRQQDVPSFPRTLSSPAAFFLRFVPDKGRYDRNARVGSEITITRARPAWANVHDGVRLPNARGSPSPLTRRPTSM